MTERRMFLAQIDAAEEGVASARGSCRRESRAGSAAEPQRSARRGCASVTRRARSSSDCGRCSTPRSARRTSEARLDELKAGDSEVALGDTPGRPTGAARVGSSECALAVATASAPRPIESRAEAAARDEWERMSAAVQR